MGKESATELNLSPIKPKRLAVTAETLPTTRGGTVIHLTRTLYSMHLLSTTSLFMARFPIFWSQTGDRSSETLSIYLTHALLIKRPTTGAVYIDAGKIFEKTVSQCCNPSQPTHVVPLTTDSQIRTVMLYHDSGHQFQSNVEQLKSLLSISQILHLFDMHSLQSAVLLESPFSGAEIGDCSLRSHQVVGTPHFRPADQHCHSRVVSSFSSSS